MDFANSIQNNQQAIGVMDFDSVDNRYVKISTAVVILCKQGHACVEIDLCCHELSRDMQALLLPESTFRIVDVSNDFNATYLCFTSGMFWEATAPLSPTFIGRIKDNPCVELSENDWINATNMIAAIEHNRLDNNLWYNSILRNILQSYMMHMTNIYSHIESVSSTNYSRPDKLFKDFIRLVAQYCACERDVGFYADKLFITPRYLSWVVRNVSGNTAKGLIDKHAILEIKSLLKTTELNVQEIACRLGFPNQSFFSRYFKKFCGMTPTAFRKELKN